MSTCSFKGVLTASIQVLCCVGAHAALKGLLLLVSRCCVVCEQTAVGCDGHDGDLGAGVSGVGADGAVHGDQGGAPAAAGHHSRQRRYIKHPGCSPPVCSLRAAM